MEDVSDYFIPVAALLTLMLFAYTFREGLTDIAYLALKRWRQTIFIVACTGVGLFLGAYNTRLGDALDQHNFRLALQANRMADDERVASMIDECKKFVEAKLDGRTSTDDDNQTSLLGGIIRVGSQSHWDTCAATFGMNYWKHEIFIRGEEGGPMLCKAYRNGVYRSGNVENWCATVLAPAKRI